MPESMEFISCRTLYPAGLVASILLVCMISARSKMESREEPKVTDVSPTTIETQEFVRLLKTNDYINGLCIAILRDIGGEIGDPELISLIAFSPKVKLFRPDQHIFEIRKYFVDQQCITSLVIP